MATHDILPAEYQSVILHNEKPLKVGAVVINLDWGYKRPGPLQVAYLWRIEERPGNKHPYVLVAQGVKKTLPLTTQRSRSVCVAEGMSKKITLLEYPEYHAQLLSMGWGGFFSDKIDDEMTLWLHKGGHMLGMGLPADGVQEVKREPALLRPWFAQVFWCLKHPRKCSALAWAMRQHNEEPFGVWPKLHTPAELDAEAKRLLPLYHEYQRKHPQHPGIKKAIRSLVEGTGVSTQV